MDVQVPKSQYGLLASWFHFMKGFWLHQPEQPGRKISRDFAMLLRTALDSTCPKPGSLLPKGRAFPVLSAFGATRVASPPGFTVIFFFQPESLNRHSALFCLFICLFICLCLFVIDALTCFGNILKLIVIQSQLQAFGSVVTKINYRWINFKQLKNKYLGISQFLYTGLMSSLQVPMGLVILQRPLLLSLLGELESSIPKKHQINSLMMCF